MNRKMWFSQHLSSGQKACFNTCSAHPLGVDEKAIEAARATGGAAGPAWPLRFWTALAKLGGLLVVNPMAFPCRPLAVAAAGSALLASQVLIAPRALAAEVQLALACSGTVLEARGSASLKRSIDKLRVSLTVQADAPSSKAALALLQERLDPVRSALAGLQVQDLRVGAPSVWNGYVPTGKPAVFEASSQLSGQLAPAQLQPLISQVGGLPGVRLAPVDAQAASSGDAASNRVLVQAAYRDALQRAQALAEAIGLRSVRPLQVQLEGGSRPEPMAAMAVARRSPAPFDPRELPEPVDRLTMAVTFCATKAP